MGENCAIHCTVTASIPTTRELPFPPVEPAALTVHFPDVRRLGRDELAAVSRTMSPSMVLAAYRRGIFPWPVSGQMIPWVCPTERALFALDQPPRWSRSLRKTIRDKVFTVTFDGAFEQVIDACATTRAEGTWITPQVRRTYTELHNMGWVHSVECWSEDGELSGGLYGVVIGGAFAGESMFHRRTDASKVAFAALVDRLRERGFAMLDSQVMTDHLASLGCQAVARGEFLTRLEHAQTLQPKFSP
jgi:leucyl/phenylalanyl-tRNA--protein transferase